MNYKRRKFMYNLLIVALSLLTIAAIVFIILILANHY